MALYISLLRGINVSGQKLIKMAALKKMYEDLGYKDVATYLQSGNVVFQSSITDEKHLEEMITAAIAQNFGFEVQVFVLKRDAWERLAASNPFAQDPDKAIESLYVTLLRDAVPEASINKLSKWMTNGEEAVIDQKVIYLYYPNGYGKTKLSNNAVESAFKCVATTRNWKTTLSLLSMIQNQEE